MSKDIHIAILINNIQKYYLLLIDVLILHTTSEFFKLLERIILLI